jgi:hypothetical protein
MKYRIILGVRSRESDLYKVSKIDPMEVNLGKRVRKHAELVNFRQCLIQNLSIIRNFIAAHGFSHFSFYFIRNRFGLVVPIIFSISQPITNFSVSPKISGFFFNYNQFTLLSYIFINNGEMNQNYIKLINLKYDHYEPKNCLWAKIFGEIGEIYSH